MKKIFLIWSVMLNILFLMNIYLASAAVNVTWESFYASGACITSLQDLSIAPSLDRAYLFGGGAAGNNYINVVDISDVSIPSSTLCLNLGALGGGTPLTINYYESTVSGLDGYITLGYTTGGANSGGRIMNVTNNGDTLTNSYIVAGGTADMSNIVEFNGLDTVKDGRFLGCAVSSRNIYEISVGDQSETLLGTITGSNGLEGCANTIINTAADPYLASATESDGIQLSDTAANIITGYTLGDSFNNRDSTDIISNYIGYSLNRFYLTQYDSLGGNLNKYDNVTSLSTVMKGFDFVSNSSFILADINAPANGQIIMRFYDFDDVNNITLNDSFISGMNSSGQIVTLDYHFPYIYISSGDTNDGMGIYSFIPSGFLAGENIKPRILNLDVTPPSGITSQTYSVSYNIDNPETDQINEQIQLGGNCAYSETTVKEETFGTGFNFSIFCGEQPIGIRKGVDFGSGIDLSQCSNDNIVLDGSMGDNVLGSFDIYSNSNGTAYFEFLRFDGAQLLEFRIDRTNISTYTLVDLTNNQVILTGINAMSGGSNIPTRFMFNMNPSTTVSDRTNKIYWSTNYFSRSNDNLDKTYCDGSAFCYIGTFVSTTANPMTDYYALRIQNSTGDLTLDNYHVKTTNDFLDMTRTIVLNQEQICSYTSNGRKEVRIYASDTVYGQNHLNYDNFTVIVSATGVNLNEAGEISSFSEFIEETAAIAGFSDTDKQIVAWTSTLSLSLVIGSTATPFAGFIAFVIMVMLWTVLGWLPVLYMFLLLLLGAGFVVIMTTPIFGGK